MGRRRLVQFGILGLALAALAVGGVFLAKKGKIFTKADTIVGDVAGTLPGAPQSLEATLPSVADDIPQNHWAYKYISAVLKFKPKQFGLAGEITAPFFLTEDQFNNPPTTEAVNFLPTLAARKDAVVVWTIRALGIAPDNSCGQSNDIKYTDFKCADFGYAYVNAAHKKNLFWGLSEDNSTGAFSPSSQPKANFILQMIRNYDVYQGGTYPHEYPPDAAGRINDATPITREIVATLLAYNLKMPGDNSAPGFVFRFLYPQSADTGFDLGFELYRQKAGDTEAVCLFSQAPPEEGMVEGADFGLAYDQSDGTGKNCSQDATVPALQWGAQYTYYVYLINRDGQYTNAATLQATVPAAPK